MLRSHSSISGYNSLASRQARRKNRHLATSFVGGLLLVLTYFFGLFLHENDLATRLFSLTVLWCALPYLAASQLLYRSIHMPAAEQRALLLINTLLPYLLLVLVLALMQQSYSRGAVLMVASLTTCWFWVIERIVKVENKLQLLCLDDQTKAQLLIELGDQAEGLDAHLELLGWTDYRLPMPTCDGLLVNTTDRPTELQQLQLAHIKQKHIRLYSVAAIAESITGRKSPQELSNPLWQPDGNPAYDTFKRLVDIALVLITAPGWIMLGSLTAIAIKLDSHGPILFRQIRTGLHGEPFEIWKFRTMVPQANPKAEFAQPNDQRITRLGHILRKSRLDEIPQLVNVLLGQMSLIGPRPEQYSFVNDFAITIPSYPYRHLVRPGITGWAQVMQGYAASEEETAVKLGYDLYYVSHYSLSLDLLIGVKTIATIFTGRGAR